jgi:hypothetical protein
VKCLLYGSVLDAHLQRVFNYPVRVECNFFRLVYQFRHSGNVGNRRLFAAEMDKSVREIWFSTGATEPPSETGPDVYSRRVFEKIDDLKEAASENDHQRAEFALDDLEREGYFREFLARVSGATRWKVDKFHDYLKQLAHFRRYLSRLEQRHQVIHEDQEAELLSLVREYLDENEIEVRMPWLTDFIVTMIFDMLLIEARCACDNPDDYLRFRRKRYVAVWLTNLRLFRNEVASRTYDALEMVRRLRHHEDSKGAYVIPSLIYPLLNLQATQGKQDNGGHPIRIPA